MINTKDNIWIKGVDSEKEVYDFTLKADFNVCIWAGKTSEIPEEIAKECVQCESLETETSWFWNYEYKNWCDSLVESIQSAVTKPDGTIYSFIIIFKK